MILVVLSLVSAAARDLPKLSKQPNVTPAQTTKLFAIRRDGKASLLTDLYVDQDRVVIPLSLIPKHLQNAVIAIEDERFYKHRGVDLQAIGRALYSDIESGKASQGGSTITQQYVKNTFLSSEKTIIRKVKEAILASQLEGYMKKEKILENYLNTIYFGHSAYGIESASRKFFGKNARDLTLGQSALLAGVIRSPIRYSPYTYPNIAVQRRKTVLEKMAALKFISEDEKNKALEEPIILAQPKSKKTPVPYFVEYVKQQLITKYGANVVFKGGLRVYTTIDMDMQAQAEHTINSILNRKGDPSASLVTIDPKTGQIKAMVGGRDFTSQKFNLAVQGKRQPGSSFKTFVLATALENGISQSKTYSSSPGRFAMAGGKWWSVKNSTEGNGGKPMALREATAKSVNAVFARLVLDVGADKVAATAKKMGITTPLNPYPAIALGAMEVAPLEMASAYGTLANDGVLNPPIAITKITDASGKILEVAKSQPKPAIGRATSYIVTDILKGVIRGGTGKRANIGRPAAGKTGTTQNYHDAWFVGYTPQLSTAVWVGYSSKQRPMHSVHGIRVSGGTFPAQIWASFMRLALSGKPRTDFTVPVRGLVQVRLCTESDKIARSFCPETYIGSFLPKQKPSQLCDIHRTPPPVMVPSFAGLTENNAVNLAGKMGFGVSKNYQLVDKNPSIVVSQSPKAGFVAKLGDVISLTITTLRPPLPKVPGVLGLGKNEAESLLSKAGFVVIIKAQAGDPSNSGRVLAQNPAQGTAQSRGSSVTIIVGK